MKFVGSDLKTAIFEETRIRSQRIYSFSPVKVVFSLYSKLFLLVVMLFKNKWRGWIDTQIGPISKSHSKTTLIIQGVHLRQYFTVLDTYRRLQLIFLRYIYRERIPMKKNDVSRCHVINARTIVFRSCETKVSFNWSNSFVPFILYVQLNLAYKINKQRGFLSSSTCTVIYVLLSQSCDRYACKQQILHVMININLWHMKNII